MIFEKPDVPIKLSIFEHIEAVTGGRADTWLCDPESSISAQRLYQSA